MNTPETQMRQGTSEISTAVARQLTAAITLIAHLSAMPQRVTVQRDITSFALRHLMKATKTA